MGDEHEPVRVKLSVEGFGEYREDVMEIDRAEWDQMTPDQREEACAQGAMEFALDHVGWGWVVDE